MVMDATSLFCFFTHFVIFMLLRISDTTAPPSSCLLSTYLSDKYCSHGQRTVGDHKRKGRKTPWRRPEHDLRALPGVIFGIVANAFENVFVAGFLFHPGRDRTSRMRANSRIGHDAIGRVRQRPII